MAAESNTGFHLEESIGSAFNRKAISFQSGAVNSTSEMIPMGNYYGLNSSGSGSLIFSGNSSIISNNTPATTQAGNPSGSLLLDSVPGLKHDTGLAVEWSAEEQMILNEGLNKYKDEPPIMKYIKIAAMLRDKTVRDVALRCRWIWTTRKRRKQEESHLGRKANYRKDKLAESSSKTNLPSASMPSMAAYSFQMHQMDQNERMKCEALSSRAKQLLEQNFEDFNQINSNLSSIKWQDNIELFCRTRENINSINAMLNDMRELSGRTRQMQDFPISINQELANCILPHTTQTTMFGMPTGVQPKQESRC